MRYICASIVATLVLAGTSLAATINVPADYTTIQAAIDAASDGDEIIVAPGTYTSSGNEVVNTLGKAVWLHSSDGPEATIISGMDKRRGIRCENAEQNNTIIEGFTISDCQSSCCGSGISCDPGSPTIKNCIIIENHSGLGGGGIYCRTVGSEVSNPAIINCRIENNVAGSNGGGVYVNPGCSPTITDCEISDNTANNSGGGIYCYGSSPTIADCVIQNNYCVGGGGGGVFCGDNSNPEFLNCTISGNTCPADQGGGFYFIQDCDPVLINCTISGNTCHDSPQFGNRGGGIHSNNYCHLTITGCTIAANTADDSGGGLYSGYFCDALISDTWICGNTPDQIEGSWTDGGNNTIQETCPATDEDGDGVFDNIDNCYLYNPDQADCNENGVGDVCDVADGTSYDCDQNGVPDECQPDCDGDGWIDPCDSEGDIDGDGIPDNCEDDCNDNGMPDETELENGWATDCDGNGIPDECDVTTDPSLDCNTNGIHDACDIADGSEEDCDGNAIPDSCQIANDSSLDCDGNGILDSCEIENDQSLDCNGNGTLDECDLGGQGPEGAVQWTVAEGGNGHWYQLVLISNVWDTATEAAEAQGGYLVSILSEGESDFVNALSYPAAGDGPVTIGAVRLAGGNDNTQDWLWASGEPWGFTNWDAGIPNDSPGILSWAIINSAGLWDDWNDGAAIDPNSIVIEYENVASGFDCNTNGIPDECDIADGTSNDVNGNGIPDECEVDCNANGVPDHWDIKTGTSEDCNANGIPDECDTADGSSNDVNSNGIPDECEEDCNGNGSPDDWDLMTGWSEDCNGNLIPDECDLEVQIPEGAVQWTVEEGGNGNWYKAIIHGEIPFAQAQDIALSMGAQLASVTSQDETDFINLHVAADPSLFTYDVNGCLCGGPYIGGFRDADGDWQWLDGSAWNWTNWHGGNPDGSPDEAQALRLWDFCCKKWVDHQLSGEDGSIVISSVLEWDTTAVYTSADCNTNGIPDECDIADETSEDINGDGVPDECQCLADIDGSGAVTIDDILAVVGYWGSSIPAGDLNYNGIVDIEDLLIVLGAWGPCP